MTQILLGHFFKIKLITIWLVKLFSWKAGIFLKKKSAQKSVCDRCCYILNLKLKCRLALFTKRRKKNVIHIKLIFMCFFCFVFVVNFKTFFM